MADETPSGKSPVDIIAEARGVLGSAEDAHAGVGASQGTDQALRASQSAASHTASTREEHLRRATGSFAIVEGAARKTNNPRVLKAEAERAATGAAASADASRSAAGAAAAGVQNSGENVSRDTSSAATTDAGTGAQASAGARTDTVASVRAGATAASGVTASPIANSTTGTRPKRGERAPLAPRGIAWRVALAAFVVLAVVSVAAFSLFRWVFPADAQDFQGMWYIAGTDTPIVITEDRIQLNDEVSYRYALNTDSKTLAFTFGRLQGEGRYRFSLDRQQLAIVDGAFGWWDTLGDDAGWTLGALVAAAQGKVANPADGSVEESGTVSANDGESAGGEGGAGSSDASASDAVSNGNLSEGVTLLSRTPASAKSASDVSRETSGGENAEESEGAAIGGAADASGAAGASSAADASTAADASAGDVAAADAAAALNSNSASAS